MNQRIFEWGLVVCFVFGAINTYQTKVGFLKSQEQLEKTNKQLLDLKDQVANQFELVRVDTHSLKEKVSILDESILPTEKRWAKIKKIREVIVDTIKTEHYPNVPDINGLTYIASAVLDFSEQYDVSIPLILAVIRRESAFNTHAVSHAGASGLMQLMGETAKECARDLGKPYFGIFKTRDNIQMGTWYLAKMLNMFNNDVGLAVKSYNAGPVFVKKNLSGEEGFQKLPSETVKYHEMVLKFKAEYESKGL